MLIAITLQSLAEIALVSCSPHLMRRLAEAGDPRARNLERLLAEQGEDAITLLVIANNAAILAAAALSGHLTLATLGPEHYTATALGTLAFILVVCEITPKTYAAHHADQIALRNVAWVARMTRGWPARLALAVVKGASWPIQRALGVHEAHRRPRVTDRELMSLADVAEEQDVLDATEARMFESIVEFASRSVREIMVPRVDIVRVDGAAPLLELVRVIGEEGRSRIAVFSEDDDAVLGVVYANDVLACLGRGETDRTAAQLARAPHCVPDTKPVDELFREMREQRVHLAFVIDEYGSVDGLVTMEDVLEEIVGDFRDEHDTGERAPIEPAGDDAWLVLAAATVSELEDQLGIVFAEDEADFDTLGGFLYERADGVPEVGFRTERAGMAFEVLAMDGPRITEVRVTRLAAEGEGDEQPGG